MILINFQSYKSSLKNRVRYLLGRDKSKVDILEGNAEVFLELAELNNYKTKSFNILVSFTESKQELEKKLKKQGKTIQDIYDEVIEQITAGYSKDELNILAIGHADTDNYHIHITIDSRNQKTDTQLYFENTKQFLKYLRTVEAYISLKYQVSLNDFGLRDKGKIGIEKIKEILKEKGEYREKTRDEVKEEITNILAEQIAIGLINSRDELIKALEGLGLEITRKGKNYITVSYQGEKIRLKGGIYDERRFEELKGKIKGYERGAGEDIQRELEGVERELKELQRTLMERINRRFKTARERAIKRNREFQKEAKERLKNTQLIFSHSRFVNIVPGRFGSRRNNWILVNQDTATVKVIRARDLAGQGKLSAIKKSAVSLLRQQEQKMAEKGRKYLSYSTVAQKLKEAIMNFQERRKEELEAIKSISPEEIIADLGIPCVKRPSYFECKAIWRGDKNPSLSIFNDNGIWKWKDHGTGQGGSWIDLYMVAKGWDYITAVRYLRERFLNGADLLTENILSSKPTQSRFKIFEIKEKPITRQVIKDFLREKRKIEYIPNWLKEVEYEIFDAETGEIFEYFGFGVKDEAGNYHIRYATDKAKVKERVLNIGGEEKGEGSTYTHIVKVSDTVVVVEGFIDAVRAEQLFPKHDIVILNGVENIKKALPVLAKYKSVILATDNDNAGQKVRNTIKREFANKELYELKFNAKDLDEAVKQNLQLKIEKVEKPKRPGNDFNLRMR